MRYQIKSGFSADKTDHSIGEADQGAESYTTLGRHWLIELYQCKAFVLREVEAVESIMRRTAAVARANIVSGHFHQFNPYGVSGVLVIAESHLTIHTWPEHGYAAVDIFTCSPDLRIPEAIDELQQAFGAARSEVRLIRRGAATPF